jgi:hypothetical protein
MIDKLVALLRGLARAHANVTLIDAFGLVRADPAANGESNDWENEIHPTRDGYAKLATRWRTTLDAFPRLDTA